MEVNWIERTYPNQRRVIDECVLNGRLGLRPMSRKYPTRKTADRVVPIGCALVLLFCPIPLWHRVFGQKQYT